MEKFKVGDKVTLHDVGATYPVWNIDPHNIIFSNAVFEYAKRYNPINIDEKVKHSLVRIFSGYDTKDDLSLRKDLSWKVRFVGKHYESYLYIISSNLRHMLVINEGGIR